MAVTGGTRKVEGYEVYGVLMRHDVDWMLSSEPSCLTIPVMYDRYLSNIQTQFASVLLIRHFKRAGLNSTGMTD